MARLALFSDVHGNDAGLRLMLEDAAQRGCDEFMCLGDVADGGQGGADCVRLLRERQITTLRGNHDEQALAHLTPEDNHWLASLPLEVRRGPAWFTHIAPGGSDRRINSRLAAARVFEAHADFHVLFIGHLHFPVIFLRDPNDPFTAEFIPWKYDVPVPVAPHQRMIICVGAVGYPRDGLRKIRYAIYDEARATVELHRLAGPLLPWGGDVPI